MKEKRKDLQTFDEIEEARHSEEFVSFAKQWIIDAKAGDKTSEHHMNLFAWSLFYPLTSLAIILNLTEQIDDNDEDITKHVARYSIPWLIRRFPIDKISILRDVTNKYPKFALWTNYDQNNSDDEIWVKLRDLIKISKAE